jgi:hypothetical protein
MIDIRLQAIKSLWSKNRYKGVIDLHLYETLVEEKCSVCGCEPTGTLTYRRSGERYDLHWNHVQFDMMGQLQPVCTTCKFLLTHHDLREVLRTCAKIMARKLHNKVDNWMPIENLFRGPERGTGATINPNRTDSEG